MVASQKSSCFYSIKKKKKKKELDLDSSRNLDLDSSKYVISIY